MHTESIERWLHDHTFDQDAPKLGERRTLVVIVITAIMMVVEIAAGVIFRSMALLADGLHMGSHASALTVSAFAYFYTRRHATDARFNFGTGKVNSLAAFASAVMLVIFALVMAWESIKRMVSPVEIRFDQAIFVAALGFIVNGACLLILRGRGSDHHHDHDAHGHADNHRQGHSGLIRRDHNLWSAYLHVLADALTSLLALFALLAGKYLGLKWLDPIMGMVGAALVVSWSWRLLRSSAHVLLDLQAPEEVRAAIRKAVEEHGDTRVSDLHVWAVGPGIYAAHLSVVSSVPDNPDYYREKLPTEFGLVHVTVEVHQRKSASTQEASEVR